MIHMTQSLRRIRAHG